MAAGSAHVPRAGTTDFLQGRKPPGAFARLVSDERLVARVRGGNEAAFTLLWERYQGQLLSYCRHMLGSHHEAEDAVQVVFANAYRDMLRSSRDLRVRPWLYRIARNQCISMLRVRRPVEELRDEEPSQTGLSEQVAGRAELRDLLRDLAGLPADQREALLLAELHDNSHADVAEIIGCDRDKVKSLVFQARTSLIKSRQARDVTCEEIQRQLSVLRGGSLRRGVLRRHLAGCDACRLFHAEVKQQRAALAIVLPVTPIGILKLGAAGALAASSGASGAAAGSGVATGSVATVAAKLGVPAALLKGAIATVAVTTVAAGGVATVEVTRDARRDRSTPAALHAPAAPRPGQAAAGGGAAGNVPGSIARGEHPRNPDRRNGQAGESRPQFSPQQRLQREAAARRQTARRKQALVEGRRPNGREGAPARPVRKQPVTDKHPRRPEKTLPPRKQAAAQPEGTTALPLQQVP
jgi:RNA polymerase sigma factor (sigma-70 family)